MQRLDAFDVVHVDDDEAWGDLVHAWVAPHGINLLRLRSKGELLGHLKRAKTLPRCLLLDLGLGDSNGLGLCDEIKSSPALQQVPIVVMTASAVSSCECLEHGALHRVLKGPHAERELLAALRTVITQHDRSQGVVDAGDLRLDSRTREVGLTGKVAARLPPGPFHALLLLVKSSPAPVPDEKLYQAFLERKPYHQKADDPLTIPLIVKNYVSRLRRDLGEAVGSRIERTRGEGYAYLPSALER